MARTTTLTISSTRIDDTPAPPPPKRLNADLLTLSIHPELYDVTSLNLPHIRRHRLVLSFEILEPSLDKLYHLPMDLLDFGRLLLRISQSVLVPVVHPIYRGSSIFPDWQFWTTSGAGERKVAYKHQTKNENGSILSKDASGFSDKRGTYPE